MSTQEPASPSAVPVWSLPDRLRKARLHAGLEQTELETMTGISRKSISNYENGYTEPNRPVLLSWALACNVPLDWLAGTGPTPRGRRRRARGRPVAVLFPMACVTAGYLFQGVALTCGFLLFGEASANE
jgi:DNA-binding XRE family transcriptional regulator